MSSRYCAVVKIITKLINIVVSVLHAHGVWHPSGAVFPSPPSLCAPHVISHGSQTVSWPDIQTDKETDRQRDRETDGRTDRQGCLQGSSRWCEDAITAATSSQLQQPPEPCSYNSDLRWPSDLMSRLTKHSVQRGENELMWLLRQHGHSRSFKVTQGRELLQYHIDWYAW